MIQEEKQLLVKDLSSRFPYGVICRLSVKGEDVSIIEKLKLGGLEHFISGTMDVKPYLRPMSSMTEEEKAFLETTKEIEYTQTGLTGKGILTLDSYDYLNSIHVDYRGLIPMGLTLEAPEGMYKTK